MSYFFVLAVFFLLESVCLIGFGYFLGRPAGIAAERLRVAHIFEVALGTVSSGAVRKVLRRIDGTYTDAEFREALVRECEHRENERAYMREMIADLENRTRKQERLL